VPLFRAAAPSPAPAPPGGGDVYGAYITSQVDYERSRQASLEARASTVVTTAGTLVTLLFGLVAVITGASGFKLPGAAHGWLIAAVILFVVAIGLAVTVAVIPLRYGQVDFTQGPAQLWQETATAASEHVAEAQLVLIKIARKKNSRIGWIVLLSGLAELAALTLLAVAVTVILK
jgi:hypothetical protein